MDERFVEILGDKTDIDEERERNLLSSPSSSNESPLPAANQLKRKIFLKVFPLLNSNQTALITTTLLELVSGHI
jgi:hypothetical protein